MIEEKYMKEYAWLGDRIYMNCSYLGMQPERSRQLSARFLTEYTETLGRPDFGGGDASHEHAKRAVAALINADPEDIALTMNTTAGNSLLPFGYPFQSGDEVICADTDFPIVWLPWARLQKKGVKLVLVKCENGAVPAESLIAAVTPKTKAIGVSWVQSSSGYKTDLKKLGSYCREHGILLSVDAIQGLGRNVMDVQDMKIDVLSSSSYKGLLGVMGAAFCYVRKEVMAEIEPHICGGNIEFEDYPVWNPGTHVPAPEFTQRGRRVEAGTSNHYGNLMMSTSVEMLTEIGIDRIQEQVHKTETYLRKLLKDSLPELHMLGSEDPATWSGTLSFEPDEAYREPLEKALEDAKISVTVGSRVRISLHYYNTAEQAEKLVNVLKQIFS